MFRNKKETDDTVTKSAYDLKVKELSSAINEVSELKAQVTKHKEAITALNGRLEKMNNSVNARVNESLASIGVAQFAVETIYNSQFGDTSEGVIRKFNSLPVEARREYYNQHKDVINNATACSDVPSVKKPN